MPGNLSMPLQSRMAFPMLSGETNPDAITSWESCLRFARRVRLGTHCASGLGLALVCSVAVRVAGCGSRMRWHLLLSRRVLAQLPPRARLAHGGSSGIARHARRWDWAPMIYVGALTLGCFLVGFLAIFGSTVQWRNLRMDRQGNLLQTTETLQDGEM